MNWVVAGLAELGLLISRPVRALLTSVDAIARGALGLIVIGLLIGITHVATALFTSRWTFWTAVAIVAALVFWRWS